MVCAEYGVGAVNTPIPADVGGRRKRVSSLVLASFPVKCYKKSYFVIAFEIWETQLKFVNGLIIF